MKLRPLTPDERCQAGVTGGLVVEESSGRAADAGIQEGDVVLSVNGTPVNSVVAAAQPGAGAWRSGGLADPARRQPRSSSPVWAWAKRSRAPVSRPDASDLAARRERQAGCFRL